jgi:hypothetical protein
LRIILVGTGIAKVDEQPIPEILRDMSLIARNDLSTGLLVGAHDLTKLFRIELFGQHGGADEVTEHHRQLTPLGL